MKLINQVKKHGKAVTLHLKRHHKKYIFGILSVSLFVKGISLIVAHTLVHNLSFADIITGDDDGSIIDTEFDNNELTENLDELTDGLDTGMNGENTEFTDESTITSGGNLEESENSTDPEEPIVDENPEEPENLTNSEEPVVSEDSEEPVVDDDSEEPENLTNPKEPIVDETLEEPENLTNSEEPVVSEDPEEPENSTDLEEAVVSEDPEESENSTDPEEPIVDENPEEPENLTNPEEPIVDDDSEEPENLTNPKEPIVDETLEEPENSTDPEEPVVSEDLEEPTVDENSDDFVTTRGLGNIGDMTEELGQNDEIWDDEMYPEDFEDFEEELDEEYGENIPQEIYDNTKGDTYDLATFEKAVKEVAYAYYMRGPRIQYNSLKANASGSWLSPEEATTQDSNYLVCSAFTRNVYYDLLKIKIPTFTDDLINYTTGHIGSPEVVGYGVKSGGNFIMKIYDSGVEYMVYENPNLSDIIPYLRIGDILTYNGHTLMVYDLVYDDETGNIDDVILMQSAHGEGKGYVKTKIGVFKEGSTIGRVNAFLYHNSKTGVDGLLEGSLNLISIKNESYWKKIGTSSGKTNYSILRFVQEDESGNVVLTYGGYSDFSLPDKTKDRLKFSKLFIEKTVSEHDDDVVELGSTMKYIIFVKNNSNEDYTDDLIITENLSNYVTYIEYTGSKSGIYFNKSGLTLEWNVGKLRSGEEVTIEYSVDVDKGNIGDIIISTGSVGKIPSAKIKNEIGKVLNEEQGNDIKNAFENLKSDYNGKELIDKIYEQSLGIDLNFKEFDITNLINNSNLYSTSYTTISGNQKNSFYKMILNKYWSTLKLSKYNYENIPTIYAYLGKYWRPLSYSSRRADTINSENFRTGDILIYTNTNDNTYTYSEASGLTIKPITYENGEYAYIYIDGKFVGVNLGNNGVKDQQTGGDDRNEFTRQYYIDNSLSWYSHSSALSGKTNEFKESLQLQTLFGKNYYVILRPSLIIRNITYELDGGSNDSNNPSVFILGRDVELKEPRKTGYVFSGWYTDSEYTTQVTNTNELTDDVVLYAQWEKSIHDLTTREKAFQEVAYAYYMRGPFLQYNLAKGIGSMLSPEQSTSQDYHHMACTTYVMNVYKELLGIDVSANGEFISRYAKKYVGVRPEVIGYGEKSGKNLYWWNGTTEYLSGYNEINPSQSYIISQLKIGDIVQYGGHSMLVYDYIYDDNGDVVDLYLLNSLQTNYYMSRMKAGHGESVSYYDQDGNAKHLNTGLSPWSNLYFTYRSGMFEDLGHRVEGTIRLENFKYRAGFKFPGTSTSNYQDYYVILRFVTSDSSGNSVLNFDGSYIYFKTATQTGVINNQEVDYSDSVKSRLKYSKLYIEKTVDKRDNNIVEPNDELTYTIKIQNNSDKLYDDLIVKENIDTELVQNLGRYSYTKNSVSTNDVLLQLEDDNQLQWNIGKLNSGDEVVIEYIVKVKTGHIGETIESIGLVDDIPSGIVKNKIGRNLKKQNSSLIGEQYEELKTQYTGKTLINEIYKRVYNVDLGLDKFIITGSTNSESSGLISYNNGWGARYYGGTTHAQMYINKKNIFSGMVLNSYFNTLYENKKGISIDDINIIVYVIPAIWKEEDNLDNRANIIYSTDFQTGDVLIYINENDVKYTGYIDSSGDKKTKITPITYENGEYAYIYINGKFVGVNSGNDLGNDLTGTRDDRNEFTSKYYVDNDLSWYTKSNITGFQETDEFKEWLQYQTLFGKNAYVVLRPSLVIRNISYELSGGTNDTDNPSVFILGRDVELKEPTKTGYVFSGWYTDSEYTTQVTNTNELTDDVVLYAQWEKSIHDLTTREKAFQEVAYSYYMRGPYIHYNSAKGRGHDFSPEEATSQDYNYLACGLYVLNVYRQLLGHLPGNIITFPYDGGQRSYAKAYVGKRPEVIGYGQKSGGNLYWWNGTTIYASGHNIENPDKSYIISQLKIGDILGYEGHVTMVYDYKYNESGDIEDVYLIHATDKPNYRVYSKLNLGETVQDKSGNVYELSIGHNKWSAIRYNHFDRTTQSDHHPDARVEGTVQIQMMSDANSVLKFNTNNYSSHYYILRFVNTDDSGNSVLSIEGRYGGYQECSGCIYYYSGKKINYSDSVQSRLKYSKLYIEKTVNKWDNSIVGVGDELTYTIRIQNNSDKVYDHDLIVIENINIDLVENLGLYSYTKNGVQANEIQLLNNGDQLQWNIGQLNSGDELIIEYTVKVRPGNVGETIESTGMVGGIPSGILTNTIGRNTDKGENLKQSYNELKGIYTGKMLINEVYKAVYGADLGIDKIVKINTTDQSDTGALIYYNNKWGSRTTNWDDVKMRINRKSPYSGMVLNGYFNVLYKNINDARAVNKSGDEISITRYGFPAIAVKSNDIDKRADTIFPSNFMTGDILIYKNSNDVYYNWSSNGYAYVSVTNTYENGEYAYVYIDGKFVGVNLGTDLTGTKDDRNEFTINYYNGRSIYTTGGSPTPVSQIDMIGGFKNWLHYQTLFLKDAYVVLRPSLMIRSIDYELDGGINDDQNPNVFILGRDVELKEPTRTGYVFSGWYTDSEYTTQVTNTNEFTDDVVLYAKWENSIHELTTFEKAFQEVAYAYYMRGPYLHYNSAKGFSDILSPEESTSQDYHYMTCTPYVMNVYKELLGIVLTPADAHYVDYAKDYVGKRPEVIGYGEKSGNNLYWWDGTTKYESGHNVENPTQNYIISQLKIGDILHYAGHVMLVYDYVYDESGNIVDVYLLHSWQANYKTYTKADHTTSEYYYTTGLNASGDVIYQAHNLKRGLSPWSKLGYNYRDRRGIYEDSRIEGTVILQTLKEKANIDGTLSFSGNYKNNYVILRFVDDTDGEGSGLLNFDGQWTGGSDPNDTLNKFIYSTFLGLGIQHTENNTPIVYSDSVQSRLNYSKLYIEKTVDKKDNNIVEPDDELTYSIAIKNESKESYDDVLIVKENINTNLVEYLSRISTSDIQLISNSGNQLQWNIGKLNSGNEVIIEYTVRVKTGHLGETIESTGLVDNIPSGTIKNKIGKNLKEQDNSLIASKYNELKSDYTGRALINEIYRNVYGVDLGLDSLIMTGSTNGVSSGLILYNGKWNAYWNTGIHATMYINSGNMFSGMILNSYFNTLRKSGSGVRISQNGVNIILHEIPALWLYENPDNRANTIYPTDFQTGDILIYTNENDIKYALNGYDTVEKYITYEDGEYAYIYIDGKFVGVNLGNDGIQDQKTGGDDRNVFITSEYYEVNNLISYTRVSGNGGYLETGAGCGIQTTGSFCIKKPTDELIEFLRYQSLFGKDAYVILRPSLMIRNITYELDGGTNNVENPNAFILGREVELKEPTKIGYVFSGWYTDSEYTTQVTNTNELTDDVVLYAKWENTYTVTWKNRDGTVLETDEDVEYGSSPEYNGSIPTKTGDAQYSYTFAGWSPTTGVVQGDVTYTAQYTTSINEYLITFKNYDGSILETGIVVYGETPTYNGNTPSKEGGYEFSGWNPTIHPVNGIQVYTAMFRDIQGPIGEIIVSYLSGYLTNGCTSGNITLTLTGSDINGLATEPYKRNEGLWTTNPEKIVTSNTQGTGYIKDVAGNVTPIPYNITGISKTGLVISLDSPENGSILTGFVKLERAASIINPTCQALSGGYNIIVYSGTEEVYTGNTGGTSIDGTFQDGTYTWKVYTNDILGHTSTSETWTFIIDKQAPTCDIDYTPAESLGWTSGDVQSILTGCSQGTIGFNATGYLFTGNGTYEFTFRNELGITGNKIAHVRRIDKIPPYLQEVTPIGTTTDTTPNYTFSSTESGSITYSGVCRSTTTQAISGNNTITLNALAVGTYSGCTITVTDRAGNISNVLNISEFKIKQSGGGGSTLKRDKCPGGDFSDSYYDGICENNRKNTHNAPNTDIGSPYQRGDEFIYDKQIFDAKYSDEMNQAYQFAYYYGITTKNSISAADMNGSLTRVAMAKMLSQYAINVLGKEPDNTRQNTFVDVSSKLDSDYSSGVTLAYQLGIMGINMKDNKFRPYDTVSRAEFVTALSRLLYGIEDGKDKYYSTHMNLLKYLGIITNTDPTMKELRGYVMLMLMRSAK